MGKAAGTGVAKAQWKAGPSTPQEELQSPRQVDALTILTQVQLGQAPAIKGFLKDGAVVTVTHGVQVHGFVVHHVLKQQRHQAAQGAEETQSQVCDKQMV